MPKLYNSTKNVGKTASHLLPISYYSEIYKEQNS